LYLREYPNVEITYDGAKIDPASVEDLVVNFSLPSFTSQDDSEIAADLTVIEWTVTTERALFLCDSAGFALAEMPPGIQAPGFSFTAYLKSEFLRELDEQNALVLEDLHPDLHKLLESSKEKLRDHFRQRTAELAIDVVAEWKKQKVYPFEGEPSDIIDETERQVFDVVALNLNAYLPDFERADPKNKRLALQLLKQALEKDPTALQAILQDVLNLPFEKQEELAALLKKTSLTVIINAAKTVANRLNFIAGLETLVFEAESKRRLLERSQLHHILAGETWIFGEEFNLTVDDKSLNEVLRKHIALLGRSPEDFDKEPVIREDGTTAIVDLMLSRIVPQPRADEREHLVIELKRPSVKIDPEVTAQIKSYAFAVAEDERFKDTKTRWIFWVVSNEITDAARREARQKNRPEGILFEDEENRITVWVRTWGQIIESSRGRLEFFKKKLEYSADQDSGLEYLRKTHDKYLPRHLRSQRARP
jgi:PAS domain-containing protein